MWAGVVVVLVDGVVELLAVADADSASEKNDKINTKKNQFEQNRQFTIKFCFILQL